MNVLRASPVLPVRDCFLADHRRMEALLEQLLAAFEANAQSDIGTLWSEFESSLLAHLAAEEAYLIPELQRVSARDARVLIQEHRHIRDRLAALGAGVDLHIVRVESARDFIDELVAHARSEDRLLYQWTDSHFHDRHGASVASAVRAIDRSAKSTA